MGQQKATKEAPDLRTGFSYCVAHGNSMRWSVLFESRLLRRLVMNLCLVCFFCSLLTMACPLMLIGAQEISSPKGPQLPEDDAKRVRELAGELKTQRRLFSRKESRPFGPSQGVPRGATTTTPSGVTTIRLRAALDENRTS